MKKHTLSHLTLTIVITIAIGMTSCQQTPKENQTDKTAIKDTINGEKIIPSESGYADVNGLKLYYEVYGSGKPIVMIHGSFMTIPLNWTNIIPLLAKDRKVIVTEMQGHGRTKDIPREFSYESMADDVSGLLKHLKIDSADVLGYSMGGSVAFQFAIRHPEQLRRLIVLSGTYKHDGWYPELLAMYPSINSEMFKGSPIQKQYDSLGNDPGKFEEFVKKTISIDMKPYDWTKDVNKIKAPVFIAIGDADGVQYEHALKFFRAKGGGRMGDLHGLPLSRLAIIPGTTHVGMLQHANLWIPMVTEFLDWDLNTTPPQF